MEQWVLSVSQLNEYVRRTLTADPMLKRIKLRGEISNLKRHTSGHLYFSLKDADARIACVMFRSSATSLLMRPEDGMRVVLTGQVSLYTKDGQYQFYGETMRADGVGELFLRFEMLKRRLEAEALFDPARKRPLPLLPRVVGVVTSPTGAVIRDIIQVATRRHPRARILLYPVLVQGDSAAQEIAKGIEVLSAMPEVDVLIVGRGGGSMEELWAFNEEIVARTISNAHAPVVSAVGHETDFTIADFVADVRASTPSAAAELVFPRVTELQASLGVQKRRAEHAVLQRLFAETSRMEILLTRLEARSPRRVWNMELQRLRHVQQQLQWHMTQKQRTCAQHLEHLEEQLKILSPEAVLSRGYAYVMTDKVAVDSVQSLQAGDVLAVHMHDGFVEAIATNVQKKTARSEGM